MLKYAIAGIFLLVFAGPAYGGSCRGETEKTVLYLEYLVRQANMLLDGFFWSASSVFNLRPHATAMLRTIYAWQARQLLARELPLLAKGNEDPSQNLTDLVFPIYKQACEALQTKASEGTREHLLQTISTTVEGYALCQAAAERNESWCALISDDNVRRDCPRLLPTFRLLSGDCSEQIVEAFSRLWEVSPQVMQSFCQAVAKRQKELCPGEEPAAWLCRAAADRNEQACRQGNEKAQRICLQILNTSRWLGGEAPAPPLQADDPQSWLVRGWLQPEKCLELALSWWDSNSGFPFGRTPEQPNP